MVFVILSVFGVGFAYHTFQQNRPDRIWLPIQTNPEMSLAQRKELAAMLKEKLGDPALLARVCKDSDYAATMGLPSVEEGVKDLQRRLFAEVGTAETTKGRVPSINVGFVCKVKESKAKKMEKVTNRLMVDIRLILGAPGSKEDPF